MKLKEKFISHESDESSESSKSSQPLVSDNSNIKTRRKKVSKDGDMSVNGKLKSSSSSSAEAKGNCPYALNGIIFSPSSQVFSDAPEHPIKSVSSSKTIKNSHNNSLRSNNKMEISNVDIHSNNSSNISHSSLQAGHVNSLGSMNGLLPPNLQMFGGFVYLPQPMLNTNMFAGNNNIFIQNRHLDLQNTNSGYNKSSSSNTRTSQSKSKCKKTQLAASAPSGSRVKALTSNEILNSDSNKVNQSKSDDSSILNQTSSSLPNSNNHTVHYGISF